MMAMTTSNSMSVKPRRGERCSMGNSLRREDSPPRHRGMQRTNHESHESHEWN